VTTGRAPEPTNDELWAQPPTAYAAQPAALPVNLPAIQPSPAPVPVPAELAEPAAKQSHGGLALAITSLGVGIPLTAIAASEAGLPGLIVAWIGIVCVNAAYASRRH
jgi:hypothetical protein